MAQPIVQWRSNQYKGSTKIAAKEAIAGQDEGCVVWIGVWEVVQDRELP